MFHNYDEERCDVRYYNEELQPGNCKRTDDDFGDEDLASRATNHQEGGLDDWIYESPFLEVNVTVDEVDSTLEKRFVQEANTIVDNVLAEVSSREVAYKETGDSGQFTELGDLQAPRNRLLLTRLSALRTFLPDGLLERLKAVANRSLHHRGHALTTTQELLGLLLLHVL